MHAALDAIEDLAVLRSADDGAPRILFARPASRERLCELALQWRVSVWGLEGETGGTPHQVAAGRRGRLALLIGGKKRPRRRSIARPDCEDRADEDPVWRLALATPGVEIAEEGRTLTVTGGWASNMLLAPLGLCVLPPWPESLASTAWDAEGKALLASAAAHGRAEAIGYLKDVLDWPVSWTALHGVAEVKTPVFRFIRDTSPTSRRLSVRRLGAKLPAAAARGLGFPFARRSVRESA